MVELLIINLINYVIIRINKYQDSFSRSLRVIKCWFCSVDYEKYGFKLFGFG